MIAFMEITDETQMNLTHLLLRNLKQLERLSTGDFHALIISQTLPVLRLCRFHADVTFGCSMQCVSNTFALNEKGMSTTCRPSVPLFLSSNGDSRSVLIKYWLHSCKLRWPDLSITLLTKWPTSSLIYCRLCDGITARLYLNAPLWRVPRNCGRGLRSTKMRAMKTYAYNKRNYIDVT